MDILIIIAGYDSINYFAYDLNETIQYLVTKDKSNNFEQLCRNLEDKNNKNNDNKLIYEILAYSSSNKLTKVHKFNIKHHGIDLIPLNIQTLDINKTALERDCKNFLLKK